MCVCVWPVWWASWGRPGVSGLSLLLFRSPLASGSPLVGVLVGVRLGRRGIPGNVLLSKIYILAGSEPSRPQDFCRKHCIVSMSEASRGLVDYGVQILQ